MADSSTQANENKPQKDTKTTNISSIKLTLKQDEQNKQQIISINIPYITGNVIDASPGRTADIVKQTEKKKEKKNSLSFDRNNKISKKITTPERKRSKKHKTEKHSLPTSPKSILKAARSPKSLSPKKVRFADEVHTKRRVSLWYYIDSPKRNKPQRKAELKTHTREGSEFSTDLDDPEDFGPYHNPNPGFLSDHDTHFDDSDEDESIMDYCDCNIL